MKTNRRSFPGIVAAFVSYVLLVTGIVKPTLKCVRFLRCGERTKLLCEATSPPLAKIIRYSGTVNSGPGELGTALCLGIDGDRQSDGSWKCVASYKAGSGDKQFLDNGNVRTFQVYRRRWHSLLYGRLPLVELVSEAEFEAA